MILKIKQNSKPSQRSLAGRCTCSLPKNAGLAVRHKFVHAAKYAALIIEELVRRDSSSTKCTVASNAPTSRAVPDKPAAPYVLIGASFGSFLAHHVAVAAHALGRPAAGLVLLDPWPVPPLLRTRGRRLLLRFSGAPRDCRQVCAPSQHPRSIFSTPTLCACSAPNLDLAALLLPSLCLPSPRCPHALYVLLQASVAVETIAQAALGSPTPEEVSSQSVPLFCASATSRFHTSISLTIRPPLRYYR